DRSSPPLPADSIRGPGAVPRGALKFANAGLHEAILLRQQPPEPRLVKQVVGLLFVRKKTEGKSPRFGDEFRSFFDGEVGLQQKVGHQIDDHLKAPHLPVFLEYLSFSGHTDRVLRPGVWVVPGPACLALKPAFHLRNLAIITWRGKKLEDRSWRRVRVVCWVSLR